MSDEGQARDEVELGSPAWQAAQGSRLEIVRERLRANGPVWTALHAADKATGRLSAYFHERARAREVAHGLPGINTREYNRRVWNSYDWSEAGEEWSESAEWRDSVIEHLLLANLPKEKPDSLEIGPGGGRWSVPLRAASQSLVLADISEGVIDVMRERFSGDDAVRFIVTDGAALAGVADGSIDYVWSFDVFVHIAPGDQAGYLAELARVTRPGARGLIHHAGAGGAGGGWRSGMTSERFAEMLTENGFSMLEQFDSWGPDKGYSVPVADDTVTLFEKPAGSSA